MQLSCVTVGCADPGRLADFWSAALGWEVTHRGLEGASCRPPGGDPSRPSLEFIRVDDPKTVKNRLHLGTNVS